MLKESEYFPKDRKRLFRIAAVLGIAFVGYLIYYHLTIELGDYKYTIATIGDVYSDSKSTGRYYSFRVNGQTYKETCITKECRKCKYGDKFIVRYYLNDKNISILYTDKKVMAEVKSPQDGWTTIPSNILIDGEKAANK